MTGIILLAGQLGVAIGGFMGMSIALNWYHKGGEKNGNNNIKLSKPNH